MYKLQNGLRMTLKPKNNYRLLKHKLWAFQWYIICHDMKKLIFCHFLKYELQNGFKMTLKPKNNYRFLKHKLWAFQWYIICHDCVWHKCFNIFTPTSHWVVYVPSFIPTPNPKLRLGWVVFGVWVLTIYTPTQLEIVQILFV